MKYLLLLLLMAASTVKAEMPNDLLKGKTVEYEGQCRMNAKGMLVFDNTATKAPKCIVGSKGGSQVKTVVILDESDDIVQVLEYDLKAKKQKTLWSKKAI